MSRYSPVAPIHLLEELYYGQNMLSGYQLLLAQDVLEHRSRFERLIFDMREDDRLDDPFVIMDNGVIELGTPVAISDLLEAASIVEADCIVSPDVLGNRDETRKLAMTHGDTIREDYRLMMVPQGANLVEVLQCVDWLAERFPTDGVPYLWGIPRWISTELGTRSSVLTYIHQYYPHSQIHLLGMSINVDDDLYCCEHPLVMGIDSANPICLAYHGYRIDEYHEQVPRGDLWTTDDLEGPFYIDMGYNVGWMHGRI